VLVKFTDRWPLGRSITIGRGPMLAGVLVAELGCLFSSTPQYFLMAGLCLIAFGEGLAFACGVEMLKKVYLMAGLTGFATLLLLLRAMFHMLSLRAVGAAISERAQARDLASQAS